MTMVNFHPNFVGGCIKRSSLAGAADVAMLSAGEAPDVVAADQRDLDHVLGPNAPRAEIFFQCKALDRRIADKGSCWIDGD